MDKVTAKLLREKLNQLIPMYGISEDYEIRVGNATYNDTEVTFKVTIKESGAPNQDEKDLVKYASLYDLDVDRIATIAGNKYSLVGFNTRATKQPFIIQKLGIGKEINKYKITVEQAKEMYGKEAV